MRVRRGLLFTDERGATAIIVVLSLIALVGMVALAVDGGSLVVQRRRMVRASDAAALAAALSFSLEEAACGSNEQPAIDKADEVAHANAANATRVLWETDCVANTVTVKYGAPVKYGFAPALGFSDRDVHATSRATWGGAQAFFGSSLMLRADTLRDCQLLDDAGTPPPDDADVRCGIWINNGSPQDLGNAQWAMLNLFTESAAAQYGTQWGWDVPPTYNCPQGVDAGWRARWLTTGIYWSVPLDGETYVCPAGGSGQSVIQALKTQQYQIKQWPVNCAWQGNPTPLCDSPHGQLQKSGSDLLLCPPDSCFNPDRYDVVMFLPLKILDFPRGDTAEAVGSQAQTGDCKKNQTFDQDGGIDPNGLPTPPVLDVDLDTLNGNGCPAGTVFDSIAPYNDTGLPNPPSPPYVFTRSGQTWTARTLCDDSTGATPSGCDYYYDPATHVITWLNFTSGTEVGVWIEFNWTKNATAGYCGSRPNDANATCLVLQWVGPYQGGEDVGSGGSGATQGVNLLPPPPE